MANNCYHCLPPCAILIDRALVKNSQTIRETHPFINNNNMFLTRRPKSLELEFYNVVWHFHTYSPPLPVRSSSAQISHHKIDWLQIIILWYYFLIRDAFCATPSDHCTIESITITHSYFELQKLSLLIHFQFDYEFGFTIYSKLFTFRISCIRTTWRRVCSL